MWWFLPVEVGRFVVQGYPQLYSGCETWLDCLKLSQKKSPLLKLPFFIVLYISFYLMQVQRKCTLSSDTFPSWSIVSSLLFLVIICYITRCLSYYSYYSFFPFSSLDFYFLHLEAVPLGTYMFRIIITDSHFYHYQLFLFTVVCCKEVGLHELVHHSVKHFKVNSGDTLFLSSQRTEKRHKEPMFQF